MFPSTTNQNSTPSYKQHLYKLDKSGNDFRNGLKIKDILKTESKNNVNLSVLELMLKMI